MTISIKNKITMKGKMSTNGTAGPAWNVEFISADGPTYAGWASYGAIFGTLVEGHDIDTHTYAGTFHVNDNLHVAYQPTSSPVDTFTGIELEGFGTFLTADVTTHTNNAGATEWIWTAPGMADAWVTEGETVRARIF